MSTHYQKKKERYKSLNIHSCWSYITNCGLNNSIFFYVSILVFCMCSGNDRKCQQMTKSSVLHDLCVLDNIVLSLANWILRLVQKRRKKCEML